MRWLLESGKRKGFPHAACHFWPTGPFRALHPFRRHRHRAEVAPAVPHIAARLRPVVWTAVLEKARRSCGLRTFRNGKPADRMTALRISRAQHGRHWLSYGIYGVDMWRGAATYVDRILHGAKPAELPV